MELMNGSITVESEKGKGTTFCVTVTLGEADRGTEADAAAGEDGAPKEIRASSGPEEEGSRACLKGRRVLLAEDVEVNAEIMVMVLGMREMETDVAENGRIAVEMYLAQPAGYYDAILMDIRMPE